MLKGLRSSPKNSSNELSQMSTVTTTGDLEIIIVGADNLLVADIGGKSDPFVVVELDGQSYRTDTEYRTLSPRWKDAAVSFPIVDISSVLFVTVFDEDRFGDPEFLGKAGIPIVTLDNEVPCRKVLKLRDQDLRQSTKGSIEIILRKKWNPFKVAAQTVTPHNRPTDGKVFKSSTFVRNVQRVRNILYEIVSITKFIQTCFEWTEPARSVKALVLFVMVTFFFELYMIPMSIIVLIFVAPAWKDSTSRLESTETLDDAVVDSEEAQEEMRQEAEKVKTLSEKLRSLQNVTVFVQDSLGFVASTIESIWTLILFKVPFMSWLFVLFLFGCTLILYNIPLRWIVMFWGVNKFTKKLRNPNHIPSSELLNFLSRVPDLPTLEKYFDDATLEKTLPEEAEKNIDHRSAAQKRSFLGGKLFKKSSKS